MTMIVENDGENQPVAELRIAVVLDDLRRERLEVGDLRIRQKRLTSH